jgi:hypothetical protein
MMEAMADRPPIQVMPMLARRLLGANPVHLGVLRTVVFEVSLGEDVEFLDEIYRNTQVIVRYLERQVAVGHLRPMDPVLAMQAFLAPVMLHAVSRPALEQYGLLHVSLEEAANEFTDVWLRAMAPPRRHHTAEKTAARAR